MSSLEETLRLQVAKSAKIDPSLLRPDTDLVRDLGLSSLELLNLLAFAEQRYGITIPDRELALLTTVQRIAHKVEELANEEKDPR